MGTQVTLHLLTTPASLLLLTRLLPTHVPFSQPTWKTPSSPLPSLFMIVLIHNNDDEHSDHAMDMDYSPEVHGTKRTAHESGTDTDPDNSDNDYAVAMLTDSQLSQASHATQTGVNAFGWVIPKKNYKAFNLHRFLASRYRTHTYR